MDESIDLSTIGLTQNGTNEKNVVCPRCPSKLLRPTMALHTQVEHFLPFMHVGKNKTETEGETLRHYWCVDDVYTFENIGFSKNVGNEKFLICADCEVGPLGWQDLETKKSYVALQRVQHS